MCPPLPRGGSGCGPCCLKEINFTAYRFPRTDTARFRCTGASTMASTLANTMANTVANTGANTMARTIASTMAGTMASTMAGTMASAMANTTHSPEGHSARDISQTQHLKWSVCTDWSVVSGTPKHHAPGRVVPLSRARPAHQEHVLAVLAFSRSRVLAFSS